MRMKSTNILIALLVFGALVGCTGKNNGAPGSKGVELSQPTSPSSPMPPTSHPTTAGTGDSGGGNLYLGKPLESYIRKPTDLSAYKNVVQRIVEAAILDIQFPMKYILEAKTWYFVPGPLSALPAEKVGSVVPTEQAALQSFGQVWIDRDLFDKMSEADQGKLLLHEILMGFKLLKYGSPQAACHALHYTNDKDFHSIKTKCESQSTKLAGKASDLSPLDYEDIRHTTTLLLASDLSTFKDDIDWRTLFHNGNFHFADMYYVSKDQFAKATFTSSLLRTKLSLENGYQPRYGYSMTDLDAQFPKWKRGQPLPVSDGFTWKSSTQCLIDLNLKDSTYYLKIQVGDYKIETTYLNPEKPDDTKLESEARNYIWVNGEQLWERQLAPLVTGNSSSQHTPNNREREDRIVGLFDDLGNLRMITIAEWYLRKFEYEGSWSHWTAYSEDTLRGDYFVCSIDPEIKFQHKPNTPHGHW